MRPTVCYVASYDPNYARNLDLVRAFEAAGTRVEFVRPRDSDETLLRRKGALRTGVDVVARALLRPFDVGLRLLRCRVLVIGYLGYMDMLTLAPIAKLLGRPVVFNPLVTLTDTLVQDRQIVSARSPAALALRQIDRLALRCADLTVVDTDENADFVAQLAGVERSRLLVIPVGADERVFYPSRSAGNAPEGRLDVLYYGKFIPLHGVETIIRAAALLQVRHPGVRFELIGTGQEYAAARLLATQLRLENIRWTDWLPYSGLGERLRRADVALGIFDGGGKAARVIPNKVHQALACGVPVVTRASPAVERLLADRQSALLVPPDDPAALAAGLVELADDTQLREDVGRAGRYAWEQLAATARLQALAGEALERVGVSV